MRYPTYHSLRMEERFILGDSRDARKPQNLKVKLVPFARSQEQTSEAEVVFIFSAISIQPLTQAFPMARSVKEQRLPKKRGRSPASSTIWFQSDQLCALRFLLDL